MASTGAAHSPTLRQWQDRLRDGVVGNDARVTQHIAGDDVAGAEQRLRIYTEAYALRLLEIMQDDFPALHARLGHTRFEALARAYIAAHPSGQHSVRWFGQQFAAFLRQHRTRPAWIGELAAFEWNVGEVLDAADAGCMSHHDLAAIAPDQWPQLRLQLAPSVRLCKWSWNVAELVQATEQARSRGVEPRRLDRARWHVMWRHDLETRWRQLPQPEAWALRAVQRGAPLASVGSWLQRAGVPQGQVPAQLVTCLQQWLGAGLIRANPRR